MDLNLPLNKRTITLLMVLIFLSGYIYIYSEYSNFRDKVNRELSRYKEIKFLLNNFKESKKTDIDEVFINQFFKNKGIEIKSISRVEDTFLITINTIDLVRLTDIIYSIERQGIEILQISAVDNTGKGRYEVKIKIR